MAFVAAKCTQCGANIQVDDERDAGFCTHCGTPFVTEKVIHNYVTYNQTVTKFEQTTNINAQTVHMHNDEINRLFMIEQGVLVKYKGKLKKVTVPEGVLEIGEDAFVPENEEKELYVEVVTLPKSLTVIQKGAFFPGVLREVNVPEDGNLKRIESGAFADTYYTWGFKGFLLFLVPSSVEEIEKGAFGDATVALFRESEEEVRRKFPDLSDRVICGFEGFGKERGFSFVYTKDKAYVYDRKSDSQVGYPATLGGKTVAGYFRPYRLASPIEKGVEVIPRAMFEKYKDFDKEGTVTSWSIPNTVRRIEEGALLSRDIPTIAFEEGTTLDFWSDDCVLTRECYKTHCRSAGMIRPPKLRKGGWGSLRLVEVTVDAKVRTAVPVFVAINTNPAEMRAARNGIYKDVKSSGSDYCGRFNVMTVSPGETKTCYWAFGRIYLMDLKEKKSIEPEFTNEKQNDGDILKITVTRKKGLFGSKLIAVGTYEKKN